jgi:hypothetical protein
MNVIELHEKAMHHSFLAKQANVMGDIDNELFNYQVAVQFETRAVELIDEEITKQKLIDSLNFLKQKIKWIIN